MLNDYLNQTAELQRQNGTNQRGQPVFSEIITIKCRLQQRHSLIKKSDSEIISAEHVCYLTDEVRTGDKINDLTVLAVNDMINLDGELVGYRAVM